MSGRDDLWDALKAHSKEKFDADRQRFLELAIAEDDGGWTKHTPYHWSRTINGEKLQYWPSRSKWMWRGKVYRGSIRMWKKITGEPQ